MNFNRKTVSVLVASLLIGAVPLFAVGKVAATATGDSWVINGTITGTPHDLSGSTVGAVGSDDNDELCVYCHTPHAANSSFTGAPLWNKADANVSTTYRMYGATVVDTAGATIAGTVVGAGGNLASPSLACLSCHDGVSAVNSILNAPGSGNGNLASPGTPLIMGVNVGRIGGGGGDIGAGSVGDVDMANDHPVSIAYTTGTDSATNPGSLRDKNTSLSSITVPGGALLWAGGTKISDFLRNGNVECSTCHDPHNGYAPDQNGTEVNYLRTSNTSSRLCLTCHDK